MKRFFKSIIEAIKYRFTMFRVFLIEVEDCTLTKLHGEQLQTWEQMEPALIESVHKGTRVANLWAETPVPVFAQLWEFNYGRERKYARVRKWIITGDFNKETVAFGLYYEGMDTMEEAWECDGTKDWMCFSGR